MSLRTEIQTIIAGRGYQQRVSALERIIGLCSKMLTETQVNQRVRERVESGVIREDQRQANEDYEKALLNNDPEGRLEDLDVIS